MLSREQLAERLVNATPEGPCVSENQYISPVAHLKTVSICAPAFNEEGAIASVIRTWVSSLEKAVQDKVIGEYEIVICDDGSSDSTVSVLRSLQLKNLVIIQNISNQGAGIAIRNAIASSKNEYVITIDSDGQFNLGEALRWFLTIEDNMVVLGYRRKADNLFLKFGTKISTKLFARALKIELPDANCMLKLIPGEAARKLDLRAVGLNYSGEMTFLLIKSQLPIKWQPVSHQKRLKGKSNAKLFRDGQKRLIFQFYIIFEHSLIKKNIISKRDRP